MSRIRTYTPIVALTILLVGCAREFGPVSEPKIEVLEPDLSVVQTEAEILLRVTIDTPRPIDNIRVGTTDLTFTAVEETWTGPISLDKGLNQLLVRTSIEDEPPFVDTLNAYRLSVDIQTFDQQVMPFPIGGHRTTKLSNGDYVLSGGSFDAGGPAIVDVFIWRRNMGRFFPVRPTMRFPRVGHSATLLPDGRILLLGGAIVGNAQSVADLVEFVEIFDPDTESFQEVPVQGDPIRRMYHSASLRTGPGGVFIDLIGGRGDIQYEPDPLLGIRRDLRTFELKNGTLHAIHPAIGPFVERTAGHHMTPLVSTPPGQDRLFHLTGMAFGEQLEPLALSLDFASPVGIDIQPALPPITARIRHTGSVLRNRVLALIAGRGEFSDQVFSHAEIYADEAGAYFKMPFDDSDKFPARYGHTATQFGIDRIMILGGFDANGDAMTNSRVLHFEF